jgi:prepilin-type N-terminal cleavage/methylation domain-containing protein
MTAAARAASLGTMIAGTPPDGFELTGRVQMSERDGEEKAEAVDPGSGSLWGKILRRRRSRKRDQRGLTLVELMIVVTIIAIIAAVAIAVYQDIVKKSKLAADQGVVSSLRSAVAIYYGRSNGLFPASLNSVEALVQPAPVYNCTVLPVYEPTNGKITFSATVDDCP